MISERHKPRLAKKTVEQRLRDQWITVWHNNLVNKSVCSSYKLFKEIYCLESYLLKLSSSNRKTVCRLRACNHKFPIVSGRHQDVRRQDRVCNKCTANVVGDEFHVLLECKNVDIVRLRDKYIPNFYKLRPNQTKYVLLMQTTNVKLLCNLASFLRGVYKLFR